MFGPMNELKIRLSPESGMTAAWSWEITLKGKKVAGGTSSGSTPPRIGHGRHHPFRESWLGITQPMIVVRIFADASAMYPTANARKSKLLAYTVAVGNRLYNEAIKLGM